MCFVGWSEHKWEPTALRPFDVSLTLPIGGAHIKGSSGYQASLSLYMDTSWRRVDLASYNGILWIKKRKIHDQNQEIFILFIVETDPRIYML